jgi:hypothetical protein
VTILRERLVESYNVADCRRNGCQLWNGATRIATLVESSDPLWDGKLIELAGFSGSGKTMFCMNSVANYLVFHPMDTAIWFDIRQQFNAKRFHDAIPINDEIVSK